MVTYHSFTQSVKNNTDNIELVPLASLVYISPQLLERGSVPKKEDNKTNRGTS
jgi:hypothetical protein